MKTKLIPATLVLPLTLLLSCARHDSQPAAIPTARQVPTVNAPVAYCPHCARQISGAPQNPTYGPAAYEDNTPPRPPSTQAASSTSLVPPVTAAPATTTGATVPAIPPVGSVPTAPKPVPQLSVDADGSGYYLVAPGDSLWKIAKTFDVTIDAIKSANALESDVVVVGEKLTIPQE